MGFQIDRVILHQVRMPLVHFFETSFGRTTERQIVLVEVVADGISGWGEVTAGERPFYNEEWTESAWLILREFAAPRVVGRPLSGASEVACLTGAIRGHNMARGGLEAAVWELESRLLGIPLWQHIGGGALREIPCGVSIGIQDSVAELLRKIEVERTAGYQRIKLKIKPGWDLDVLRDVRLACPDLTLSVDANSAYTLDDLSHLRRLDEFRLLMIEQPLHHDDILDHARLQSQLSTPICLDESIRSARHARQAIEAGACGIINIKLGRVGGFSEARRVHDTARDAGLRVWCGGMLESGIGRAHNIALSTLPGFTLPGDVSAGKRYWKQDIVDPPIEVTPRGTILVGDGPGMGYQPNLERIRKLTVRSEVIGR